MQYLGNTPDESRRYERQRPSASPEVRVKFNVTHTRCYSSCRQPSSLIPSTSVTDTAATRVARAHCDTNGSHWESCHGNHSSSTSQRTGSDAPLDDGGKSIITPNAPHVLCHAVADEQDAAAGGGGGVVVGSEKASKDEPMSTPIPMAEVSHHAASQSPSSHSVSCVGCARSYSTPPLAPRVASVPLITPRYQKKTSTHTLINVTDSFPERMTATEALRQQSTETMTIKNGPVEYQQVMHFHTYDLYKLGSRQIHSRSVGYSSDGDLVLTREDHSETSDTDNGFTRKHILISEPTVLNPAAQRPLTASEQCELEQRQGSASGAVTAVALGEACSTTMVPSRHGRVHNKKYPGIFAPRNRKVRNRLLNDHFATEDGRNILQRARRDDAAGQNGEDESDSDSDSDADDTTGRGPRTAKSNRVDGMLLSSPYSFFRALPRSMEGSFSVECDVDDAHPRCMAGGAGAHGPCSTRGSYRLRYRPDSAEARWQGLSMRLRAELQHALSSEFLERQIEDLEVLFADFVQSGPAQESLVFHFKDGYGRLLCHGVAGYYQLNSESRMHVDGMAKLTFVSVPRSRQKKKKQPTRRRLGGANRPDCARRVRDAALAGDICASVDERPDSNTGNEVNAVVQAEGAGAPAQTTARKSAGEEQHKEEEEDDDDDDDEQQQSLQVHAEMGAQSGRSSLSLPQAPLMRILRRHRNSEPARHPLSYTNSPQLAPRDLMQHAVSHDASTNEEGNGAEGMGGECGTVPEVMSPLFLNGSAETSALANTFPSSSSLSHISNSTQPRRQDTIDDGSGATQRLHAMTGTRPTSCVRVDSASINTASNTRSESGGVNVVSHGVLAAVCSSSDSHHMNSTTEEQAPSASSQHQHKRAPQRLPTPQQTRDHPLNTTVCMTKNGKVGVDCVPVYVPQLKLSRTLSATTTAMATAEPSSPCESTQVVMLSAQTTATQRKKMRRAAKAALQARESSSGKAQ